VTSNQPSGKRQTQRIETFFGLAKETLKKEKKKKEIGKIQNHFKDNDTMLKIISPKIGGY
jgi:hypothetical protein